MNRTGIKKKLVETVWAYFEAARSARVDVEERWRKAHDAYKGNHPHKVGKVLEDAQKQEFYFKDFKRKKDAAQGHVIHKLFETSEIPFEIKPHRELSAQDRERVANRAQSLENQVRDELEATHYKQTLNRCVSDQIIFGTGICKAPVVQRKQVLKPAAGNSALANQVVRADVGLVREERWFAGVERISPWSFFPDPDARNMDEAGFVIQRSYYTASQLLKLVENGFGYDREGVKELIQQQGGWMSGNHHRPYDSSDHPEEVKRQGGPLPLFTLLEFWGELPIEAVAGCLEDVQEEEGGWSRVYRGEDGKKVSEALAETLPLLITVCEDQVLRAEINPFEGRLPYDLCHWRENADGFWGLGLFEDLEDIEELKNSFWVSLITGKQLSSKPMIKVVEEYFKPGQDLVGVEAGKIWKVRKNHALNEALEVFHIPDVTDGILPALELLDRMADEYSNIPELTSGNPAKHQTQTASGLALMSSHADRVMSQVLESTSAMMTRSIEAVKNWIMLENPGLLGSFEARATGYEDFVNANYRKTRLLQFLQIAAANPQMAGRIRWERALRQIAQVLNLNEDELIYSQEEVETLLRRNA